MIIDERLSIFIDALEWKLPEHLMDLEKRAVEEQVPIIRRPMQSFLGFLLRLVQPENILEIGAAVGFSSILMSEYVPETTGITTIEKVPVRIRAAKSNFRRYGKMDRITLLEGDATEVLSDLSAQGKQYDFIFMDAAKGQYMNFLPDILKMLSPHGILVTDNVLQDGDVIQSRYAVTRRDRTIHGRMREYLYYLTHSPELDTVILPVGDGITVSRYIPEASCDSECNRNEVEFC
ncbi:MAG: O-methyltransferase [Lachnospiraceae bacterium]|nr:O-methyltransferase [Lachnospiraceae bacterium]